MKGRQPPPYRTQFRNVWMRAFVWALLAVFVLGSVGAIALVAIH